MCIRDRLEAPAVIHYHKHVNQMGLLSPTGFDTIDGTVNISESESVIGYSDACLAVATEIDPKLSPICPFHAQRLATEAELDARGNVSCADIVAQAPKLYGSEWTN